MFPEKTRKTTRGFIMNQAPFPTHGIEIEYMIVDESTLDIRPVADRLLRDLSGGEQVNEALLPPLCWSNELALHVIEVKTQEPARSLLPVAPMIQDQIRAINAMLSKEGACLMPTAMHPWMNPLTESKLWPHDDRQIYEAFDRLFDCRSHGWTNLQSSHLNLPFHDEKSFLQLYHAIRVVLPFLPALAASSPLLEGLPSGRLDTRLDVYKTNCARLPTITGQVVPEPVASIQEYHRTILAPMYEELARIDTSGELEHEWLNARGAIARFDRNTIEIRVLDTQECPAADLALHAVVECLVAYLISEVEFAELASIPQEPLVKLFERSVSEGGEATLAVPALGVTLGLPPGSMTVSDAWRELASGPVLAPLPAQARTHLNLALEQGCLASRMLKALDGDYSRAAVTSLYRDLIACLHHGKIFEG